MFIILYFSGRLKCKESGVMDAVSSNPDWWPAAAAAAASCCCGVFDHFYF